MTTLTTNDLTAGTIAINNVLVSTLASNDVNAQVARYPSDLQSLSYTAASAAGLVPINQTRTVTIPLLEQISLASVSFPDVNAADTKITVGSSKITSVEAVTPACLASIHWLAAHLVTVGSGAIDGETTYRPVDSVTRGAMAQFMHKLAYAVGSTTVVPD